MPQYSVRWLGMFLVLPLALAVGCGDDDTPAKQDAAVDAPLADVAPQQDLGPQDDAPPQSDAAPLNQSGHVLVSQVVPQPFAAFPELAAIKLGVVSATWDVPGLDRPTAMLDKVVGGLGCVATYYKFDTTLDGGVTSANRSSTFNAGTVTINGGWNASIWDGTLLDGSVPNVLGPVPHPITCARTETAPAGSGLFSYVCDLPSAPLLGDFLTPGSQIDIAATGSATDVPAFSATGDGGVVVAPSVRVTSTVLGGTVPALWAVPAIPEETSDAGVTGHALEYQCGDTTDGGTKPSCSGVIAIRITTSDVKPTTNPLALPNATAEYGDITCSTLGPAAPNKFVITKDLWDIAFPTSGNVQAVRAYVLHASLAAKNNAKTLIGAGGGQIGVYQAP